MAAGLPVPRRATSVPRQRRDRAHEHPDRAGVGAEVDAVGPRTTVPEQQRQAGAHRRQRQHRPGAPGGGQLEQEQQHERPDDVELLLDRERPQVRQRSVAARKRVDPVHAVQQHDAELPQRRADVDGVAAPVAARGRGDPARVVEGQQHARPDAEHHEQRGQQAEGPAGVEQRQRHPPVDAHLVEQHRGDEEAGQDEEDVQADPPAAQRALARGEVVGHDPDEGEAAQAVEGARPAEQGPAGADLPRPLQRRGSHPQYLPAHSVIHSS